MNKKVQELKEKYSLNETKTLVEAIELLPQVSTSKFTGSIDIDIVLNLKDNQKKESIRGSISLPHQVGEDKKVIVFGDTKAANVAKKAGAIDAGLDDLVEKVEKGEVEFDVVIATPDSMSKIVKLGKVLGPKGLMPNPKNGTIADDVAKAVESFKSGKVSFRMTPDQGTVRGKVASLELKPEEILENVLAYLKGVSSEVKRFAAQPFTKVALSPTMGASIKVDISDIMQQI